MLMAVFCLMYSFLLGILVLLCLLIFVRQVMAVFDLILTFTMMERYYDVRMIFCDIFLNILMLQ